MKDSSRFVIAGTFLSLFVGCGASSHEPPSSLGPPQANSGARPSVHQAMTADAGFVESAEMAVAQATTNNEVKIVPDLSPQKSSRKIIYNSSISLNVESFDGIATKIVQLTDECGGFIAGANLSGTSGNQRSGSWTIRLPVEQYRTFLDSTGSLGELVSKNEQTREVTAEFYDIEARVRNKQTEEKRLITLLEERPGKLDDVLTFEKEISRVRGEIEQLQGRLRVLSNLTAFSTVTLRITEVLRYAPVESPTFRTLIARQWQATVDELTAAGQWLVLSIISIGPWLLILLAMSYLAYLLTRFIAWTRTKFRVT